jgi:surfactin synthase thioesterase subunit
MSKPSLIFLPGAWHSPEVFDTLISKLSAHGYTFKALPLQAVIQNPAVKDLQPDINALRSAVLKEADAGNDVMVIGHSWGSIIVCGGLEGLSKEGRMKQGMEGGVVKLAFLTGFVPPENVSLIQAFGGSPPEWYDVKVRPNLETLRARC